MESRSFSRTLRGSPGTLAFNPCACGKLRQRWTSDVNSRTLGDKSRKLTPGQGLANSQFTLSPITSSIRKSTSYPKTVIGGRNARRQRFGSFLSAENREDVRSIQNAVIAALQFPPASYPILHVAQQVTDLYLKQFKTVSEPYPQRHDIWFRYSSPEHAIRWARFIIGKLPECISVVEGRPEQTLCLPPS